MMEPYRLCDEVKRHLMFNRFLVSFDDQAEMQIEMIPRNAFVATPEDLPKMIREVYSGDNKRHLPQVLQQAINRI
jgi:hypothetical protein